MTEEFEDMQPAPTLIPRVAGGYRSRRIAAIDPDRYVTIKGAVRLTGVSRQTIWRLCKDGELRTLRVGKSGYFVLIPREDVEAWMYETKRGERLLASEKEG